MVSTVDVIFMTRLIGNQQRLHALLRRDPSDHPVPERHVQTAPRVVWLCGFCPTFRESDGQGTRQSRGIKHGSEPSHFKGNLAVASVSYSTLAMSPVSTRAFPIPTAIPWI